MRRRHKRVHTCLIHFQARKVSTLPRRATASSSSILRSSAPYVCRFRTVAMMVPDYALIAEIKLYAYGYEDSRSLARKIVTTYTLCSEQLSSQHHYDYGMRAVFSVLVAAGALKRTFATENESVLMLRAIQDVNLAKFLASDVPLFNGITSDLFPGITLPKPDYSLLLNKLKEYFEQEKLESHPYQIEKIIQFYECHMVRHSVMLVGRSFSGKTTSLKALPIPATHSILEGGILTITEYWSMQKLSESFWCQSNIQQKVITSF